MHVLGLELNRIIPRDHEGVQTILVERDLSLG